MYLFNNICYTQYELTTIIFIFMHYINVEMWVYFYDRTERLIQEDCNFCTQYREKLNTHYLNIRELSGKNYG
jgi:hypothetical protein